MTRRVCVVVNNRANYGRIKTVMAAVREHPDLELQLILGASTLLHRFGSVHEIIRADGFLPDATIHSIIEGETPTTMAKSTGLAMIELATTFEHLRPDVVVTVADRFETMATAVAGSYMNIPVAHTQGGEVTGSIDESVRHAVTKLSHLHFPSSPLAQEYLLRMGEDPARVYLTGCPSLDVVAAADLRMPDDLFERSGGVGAPIDSSEPYLLVLQHPVTTEFGQGLAQIQETLRAVHAVGMQTVWLWPNVDAGAEDVAKGIRMYYEQRRSERLHLYRNFPVEDYLRVLNNAACVVGNSSSGIREAAFLGVPAVNIGSRQAGRERGPNVVDVPHDADAIEAAIKAQVDHGRYDPSALYGDGSAGKRIAGILATADLSVQKRLHYVTEAAGGP